MKKETMQKAFELDLEMKRVNEMIEAFRFCKRIDISNSPARCVGEKHKHFLPSEKAIENIINGLNLYYTDLKIEFDNL